MRRSLFTSIHFHAAAIEHHPKLAEPREGSHSSSLAVSEVRILQAILHTLTIEMKVRPIILDIMFAITSRSTL